MALGATTMLTAVTAVAMLSPPRRTAPRYVALASPLASPPTASAASRTEPDWANACRGPVFRATADGRAEIFEECAAQAAARAWRPAPGLAEALRAGRGLPLCFRRYGAQQQRIDGTIELTVADGGQLREPHITNLFVGPIGEVGVPDRERDQMSDCVRDALKGVTYVSEPAAARVRLHIQEFGSGPGLLDAETLSR
jgi:hypothetical protein